MARFNYAWTLDKIEKRIKAGRGQGTGKDYKPWLTVQDVPSNGRRNRIFSDKTGRPMELMSDNEEAIFLLADWSDKVKDIHEQKQLDLLETVQIAKELGIAHPSNQGEVVPMTTDFYLTVVDNFGKQTDVAYTVKAASDLRNPRVLEKMEIEFEYYKRKGLEWGIFSDENLKASPVIANLKQIYSFGRDGSDVNEAIADTILFVEYLLDKQGSIIEICTRYDELCNLELGSSLSLFWKALYFKMIYVDITQKIEVRHLTTNSIASTLFDEGVRHA
jgi:hypothetical protein